MQQDYEVAVGTKIGPYILQQRLGKGRSGTSYRALHIEENQYEALKLIPYWQDSGHLWEKVRQELQTVVSLQHGAILPIFRYETIQLTRSDAANSPQAYFLIATYHYCPFTLTDVLLRKWFPPNPAAWLQQVISVVGDAVQHLHNQRLSHGALVPGNILFTEEHPWLGDVSLARLHPPTYPYLAPEIEPLAKQCYQQNDMQQFWSLFAPLADQYTLAALYTQLISLILPTPEASPLLPTLYRAMQIAPEQRFERISQFTKALLASFTQTDQYRPAATQPAWQSTQIAQHMLSLSQEPGQTSQQAPEKTASEWGIQGDLLFAQHNYKQAKEAFSRALAFEQQNVLYWSGFGDSCFALREYTEALIAYDNAITLNATDATLWHNRGAVLDALHRYKEAQTSYRRSQHLSRNT